LTGFGDDEFNLTLRIFALFMMWYNLIYWLRVFDKTTLYICLIEDTIRDMKWFALLYVLIVITFSTVIYTINTDKMKHHGTTLYDDDVFWFRPFNALIH
jgi:hypothetical protein